jgi:hypothetical protein
MDGGGWKLTAKQQQHIYIHIRHPNDPLISAIHIHHAHKNNNKHMGFKNRRRNMDAGWWKITAKLQ